MSQSIICTPASEPETWRAVPGYVYEASDLGRVRRAGRVLHLYAMKTGYKQVAVRRDGRYERLYVHHLVMAAFIGPRPYKYEVNHKDGVRSNNRLDNLEYVTHRQNMRHAARVGLQPTGERHPNAKLRAVDVQAILACINAGKSNADIARFFGVNPTTIDKIGRGEHWASVHLPEAVAVPETA